MVSDGREYIFARTTQFGTYTSCFEPEPYVRTREIDELGAGGVLDGFVAPLNGATLNKSFSAVTCLFNWPLAERCWSLAL